MDLAKIRKKARSPAGESPPPVAPSPQPIVEPKPTRPPSVAPAEAPANPVEKAAAVRDLIQEASRALPPLESLAETSGSSDSHRPQTSVSSSQPGPASPKPEDASQTEGSGRLEKLLVFAVGQRRYAIPIHDITQIIEDQGVTPVPHAPHFLLGIFSLRGRIVSVLDSARRLGIVAYGEPEAPKIVVLDAGDELVGIRVHAIDQVVEVDTGSLEPPPETFQHQQLEFVEGVFHHRERTVSFLNLPLFLAFETGGTSK